MKRTTIYIFNVIIALVCAAAIALYFVFPVFQLSISIPVKDMIETMSEASQSGAEKSSVSAEKTAYVTTGDETDVTSLGDMDLDDLLDYIDDDWKLTPAVSLNSFDLTKAVVTNSAGEYISQIIAETIEPFVDELLEAVVNVALDIVSDQVTETLNDQLVDYLKDSGYTEEEAKAKLEEVGLTEDYMDEKVDSLVEAIQAPGATVESIANTAVDIARETYAMLQENGGEDFEDLEFTEDDEQEIRDMVSELLEDMADDEGNFDANEVIAAILLEFMSEDEGSAAPAATLSAQLMSDSSSSETKSSSEELKETLTEMVEGYIPGEIVEYANYAFIAILALLAISLLSWLYIIIKILCKIPRRNPGVKLKCPIFLGWLPFLILSAIPSIALLIVPMVLPEIAEILGLITISFWSSGVFAAIAALVLIILWIPYGGIRKRLSK